MSVNCVVSRAVYSVLILVCASLAGYSSKVYAQSPPNDPNNYRYETNSSSNEFGTYPAALSAMRAANPAATNDLHRIGDPVEDTQTGLKTETFGPNPAELDPVNFSPWEWETTEFGGSPKFPTSKKVGEWIADQEAAADGAGGLCDIADGPVDVGQPHTPGGAAKHPNSLTITQQIWIAYEWTFFGQSCSSPQAGEIERQYEVFATRTAECPDSSFNAEIDSDQILHCINPESGYLTYFGEGGDPGEPPEEPGEEVDLDQPDSDDSTGDDTDDDTKGICTRFGNPCDATNGVKIEAVVDYDGPGPSFVRTYRSNDGGFTSYNRYNEIEFGWFHNYQMKFTAALLTYDFFARKWVYKAARLSRPDGSVVTFVELEPDVFVSSKGGGIQVRKVVNAASLTGYDWVAYLKDGSKEVYRTVPGGLSLREIHDPAGRVTTLEYNTTYPGEPALNTTHPSAVVGPFGHTLQLHYGACPLTNCKRLDYVVLPDGVTTIDYNEAGPPGPNGTREVHFADGNFVRYTYLAASRRLIGIRDENGDDYATFAYDASGRVSLSEHAGDATYSSYERFEFVYDDINGTTTVKDAAGTTSTMYLQDMTPGLRDPAALVNGADGKSPTQVNDDPGQRRVTDYIDDEGMQTHYEYDNFHRISMTEADGLPEARQTIYEYLNDTSDLKTLIQTPTVTSCNGSFGPYRRVETTYHPGTQLVHQVTTKGYNPLDCSEISRTTSFSNYNAYGQPRLIDGPRTDVSDILNIEYYECTTGGKCGQTKKITKVIGSQNHITTFDTFDAYGRVTKLTEPNGLVTEYSYTTRGWVDTVTERDGTVSRLTDFDYDSVGQRIRITSPNGHILNFVWNAAHLLDYVTDNIGNKVDYTYDVRGNRVGEDYIDPTGALAKTLSKTFDARGRLRTVVEGDNPASQFVFDAVGNVNFYSDANSNDTTIFSDALGRRTTVIDAAVGTTTTVYDEHDNIIGVTAPNGATTTYMYNDFDNLMRETSPDRGMTLYGYDAAGNMVCEANGRATGGGSYTVCSTVPDRWEYSYDALNRQVSVDYQETTGQIDLVYGYDSGAGHIGKLTSTNQVTTNGRVIGTIYQYNRFGELLTRTQTIPNGSGSRTLTTSYQYSGLGEINAITYPNGRIVNYTRNSIGNIVHISLTSPHDSTTTNLVTNVTYYPFGPIKAITYGNGLVQSRSLDTAYRPSSIALDNGSTSIDQKSYSLDNVGNVTEIVDAANPSDSDSYKYDVLNRLVDDLRIDSNVGLDTYVYDASGNRTNRNANLGGYNNQSITYLPGRNRIATLNGGMILYDGGGNVLDNANGLTFTYNSANRLASTTASSTTYYNYYSGAGTLTKIEGGGTSEFFEFAPDGRILHLIEDQDSSETWDYVWLNNQPVAQIKEVYSSGGAWQSGQTELTYLHTNNLGVPTIGTDSTGMVVWENSSDAFGRAKITTSGPTVRLRLPGQINYEISESLHYNFFRDYDSDLGRYVQSDPIGLQGGANTFAYVGSNPLTETDRFGLQQFGFPVAGGVPGIAAKFLKKEVEAHCEALTCTVKCSVKQLLIPGAAEVASIGLEVAKERAEKQVAKRVLAGSIKVLSKVTQAGAVVGIIECTTECS